MTEGVNNTNTGANIASYAAFPAITLGISATHGIVSARGYKNAIKLQNHEGFKKLYNSLDCDVFTKSIKVAEEYDKHKELVKAYNKWGNKAKAIEETGKLPLLDRFFNRFKKEGNKLTDTMVKKNAAEATEALKKADNALDSIKGGAKAVKVGSEAVKLGFTDSVKTLFKKEMTSKFNMVMTAATFIPNVINNVIPAFKEQGFAAGIKETGKVLIQGVTDFVSYGFGGAIGRTLGGVIGSIFPGVGTVIGATLGDMIGSMVVGGKITKTVDKAIGADEETEEKLKAQREANKQNKAFAQANTARRFDANF